jgi:DNA polymerase-4
VVSERLFALLEEVSPLVEPLSVDEAFVDVTGCERLWGSAEATARDLKRRVRETLGLTASVGVAPNKFLAKLASELEKPDGLTVLGDDAADTVLPALEIGRLWGVGPKTAERLHARGVRTVGDLRAWSPAQMEGFFGRQAGHFGRLLRGLDDRPVTPDARARSLSQERTFPVDLDDAAHVREVLRAQADHVARRVRRAGLRARTVQVKIRTGDFTTVTRSSTLSQPSSASADFLEAACALFDRWARTRFRPVRLVGVGASGLVEAAGAQLDLFPEPGRRRGARLDRALDDIRDRFGGAAIRRGAPRDGPHTS